MAQLRQSKASLEGQIQAAERNVATFGGKLPDGGSKLNAKITTLKQVGWHKAYCVPQTAKLPFAILHALAAHERFVFLPFSLAGI